MNEATTEERWAVVLGCSCGTGAEIARALARDPGLNVFGVHRGNHPEGAASVERDIADAGRRVHLVRAEGGTAEAAQSGAEALLTLAGPRRVSLFVHSIANASLGRLSSGGADQLRPWQFQKTFDSMANSFVYWTQALLARDLLAPGAHLLGLSNWMEDSVVRGAALIAATKAALGVYVRHLARELGPRGYRVNLLKFGGVITPAVEKTFEGDKLDRMTQVLVRAGTTGTITQLEEVARFVSYLAGPSATRFNGATIDFTGGESQGLFDALMHGPRKDDVHARGGLPAEGEAVEEGAHLVDGDVARARRTVL
jgi:NAD(P)-dependent dehydrogenase (short-subunit alcohol dehydrogenase family)